MNMKRVKSVISTLIVMVSLFAAAPFALAAEHDHNHGTENAVAAGSDSGLISVSAISALTTIVAAATLIIRLRASAPRLSKMTAMMASMAVAMITGLIGGTLLGIWLQSLFFSTVFGVTIGVAAGMLAGQTHSWLAVLDGMLSGVMSGMMGAMLGVMILQEHPLLMILFMDVIMLVAVGSLYQAIAAEDNQSEWQDQQLKTAERTGAE
ncbi:hypothetical protein EYB31_34700 [Paenibacillus thalictri]|uniref:Uncharacterized protein n=2 Tax=Paenibacillus thalictri TaxID=2527873 RepID=A0A4Q9DGP4_9BACL|nr:hypothetical protein EYB31_34700 [Paenibacillus thalictri]